MILAVGGGSVCDYAKAVSVSAYCEEDPWEKYYDRMEEVDNRIIPVGCVLTMVGTGSEMNGGSVITNSERKRKIGHVFGENVFPKVDNRIIPVGCVLTMVGTGSEMNGGSVITNSERKRKIGHVFGENVFPKFSILNPVFTYTLPKYQMVAGIFVIFNQITEQYFSGEDVNTSDYVMEGLMKSLIHSSRIAVADPMDYEARSNIMWTATWALNTMVEQGKTTAWMVHMIGQSVGAYTDATHGMTLAAVSMAYYRYICPYGLQKFVRFAENVWGVQTEGKSKEQIAKEGLASMENWMREIGLVMNLRELGVTEEMIEGIAEGTFVLGLS